ncbi:unnamed protein product [Arabis nemorensis]|uniref:Uncharacterized protein n=1 Tax=Arabis nemorensis TaxID=586526 RepID=A0A565CRM0_9BRAS|nr:unnamed protein product [Arabis nemorensis]
MGHNDDEAGVTRKLGVFIRERARYTRPRTATSASATLLGWRLHLLKQLQQTSPSTLASDNPRISKRVP